MTCKHTNTETYSNPCGTITRCKACGFVLDVEIDRETAKILDELTKAYYKTEGEA